MIVGERISVMLKERRLSQSELARRANVSQPLVNGLVRGTVRSTPQLHRIARELGTTPAYLSGEVDDPDLDAPEPPKLTQEQLRWLELFAALDASSRAALLHIAQTMVVGPQPTVNRPTKEDSGEDA